VENIPFKVSAKTARLIGRENIANPEGAIGELVKNSYDADARICIVAFVPRLPRVKQKISKSLFKEWRVAYPQIGEIYKFSKTDNRYALLPDLTEENTVLLKEATRSFFDLWIIDNGSGMSGESIRKNWMVIGTDFKEENQSSAKGRRRTGAKGIGRFAMDKLARRCRLYSYSVQEDEDVSGLKWMVNWESFDDTSKTLDEINAKIAYDTIDIERVIRKFDETTDIGEWLEEAFKLEPKTGTLMRLSGLRDVWSENEVSRLDRFLARLAPPAEQKPFDMRLYDFRSKEVSGSIEPAAINDFDYRMNVDIKNGQASFQIFRNELKADEILDSVFEREDMGLERFKRDSFKEKSINYDRTFSQLFPKVPKDFLATLENIGDFSFQLMFFKRGKGRSEGDFPYRAFQPGPRRIWLDEYGGVKIYRDNFYVRPYGEIGGRSFDWLGLGERVAGNPAGAGRKGWRINPQQIVGTIKISQDKNPTIRDQTNREGIIENAEFAALQKLVTRLIQEFEDDRSHIMSNIKDEETARKQSEQDIAKGQSAAEDVEKDPDASDTEKTLASAVKAQSEKLEIIKEEQRLMQALATLGTVLVSFTHEISHIKNNIENRTEDLRDLILEHLPESVFENEQDAFNPYALLNNWDSIDEKVYQWFSFAMSTLRADRRRRKDIELKSYLEDQEETWAGFLSTRQIELDLEWVEDCRPIVLAYEIDLDSIFNNLLVNSVEVLVSPDHSGVRKIHLAVSVMDDQVQISYSDNGPGLPIEIEDPRSIMNFTYSTKYDDEGNKTGTGLGLWILDTVVSSYGGRVTIPKPSKDGGFKMKIRLPLREVGS